MFVLVIVIILFISPESRCRVKLSMDSGSFPSDCVLSLVVPQLGRQFEART